MAAVIALSESTTSLLAALLGALVGGAASLGRLDRRQPMESIL
jgi:hypothetical protein